MFISLLVKSRLTIRNEVYTMHYLTPYPRNRHFVSSAHAGLSVTLFGILIAFSVLPFVDLNLFFYRYPYV
jgi:hypothetical protein